MRVYLSYSDSDAKFAAALREHLVADGFNVWDPESELAPGSNWLKETGRALERADAIVFILSKRSTRSAFIQKEIDYALTTKRFKDRVYPVVIGRDVDVPWILRELGVIQLGAILSPRSSRVAANRIARSIGIPQARKRLGLRMEKTHFFFQTMTESGMKPRAARKPTKRAGERARKPAAVKV